MRRCWWATTVTPGTSRTQLPFGVNRCTSFAAKPRSQCISSTVRPATAAIGEALSSAAQICCRRVGGPLCRLMTRSLRRRHRPPPTWAATKSGVKPDAVSCARVAMACWRRTRRSKAQFCAGRSGMHEGCRRQCPAHRGLQHPVEQTFQCQRLWTASRVARGGCAGSRRSRTSRGHRRGARALRRRSSRCATPPLRGSRPSGLAAPR